MWVAVLTGLVAGTLLGVVLQRSRLCFHSLFAGAWQGRTTLLRGWLLGVAVAGLGLSVVYLAPWSAPLNSGLAFRPVQNVLGGLVIGTGMVVARSCVSGMFYKLGNGMLGATVGLVGWAAGELAMARVPVGGPTVLPGGTGGTIPGVLGVPRLAAAAVLLVLVVLACLGLSRSRRTQERSGWDWPLTGVALGGVTVAGWLLALLGGATFGPSTVGAARSVQAGTPSWWLVAFLVGIVLGAHLAARVTGEWWPRGETRPRYLQLVAGGFLLGAGGWLAGGCNLGHGLSGAAQLNVSSWVVVGSMALGVGGATRVRGLVAARSGRRSPSAVPA